MRKETTLLFENLEKVHERIIQLTYQQTALARIGGLALETDDLDEILSEGARCAAEGLNASFCKILKFDPRQGDFLVCAGYGWPDEVIGSARIGGPGSSGAGYCFEQGRPVVTSDFDEEERFPVAPLLKENGVRSAINVLIGGRKRKWGVLELDSREPGQFAERDVVFVEAFGKLMGLAIAKSLSA